VTVAREAGNQRFEADALCTLGDLHRQAGEAEEALAEYAEAHRLAEKIGYRRGELTTLVGLSTVDRTAGCAETALTAAEHGGFLLLAEQARTSLAETSLAAGDLAAAESQAARAVAGFRDSGHRLGEAYALMTLGKARWPLAGPAAARECWLGAEGLLAGTGAGPALAAVRRLLSR
jgi:tetratricopeptide (TPR) repeat protein